MTNTSKPLNQESNDVRSNTMKTLKELIGYDYCTSRIAFDNEGTEIVFVNESLIGRVQVYIDGELVVSRYPFGSEFTFDTKFEHNERKYRIISRTINWLTGAQEITLYVDGQEKAVKLDHRLAALNWKQQLHLVVAMAAIGIVVGTLVKAII